MNTLKNDLQGLVKFFGAGESKAFSKEVEIVTGRAVKQQERKIERNLMLAYPQQTKVREEVPQPTRSDYDRMEKPEFIKRRDKERQVRLMQIQKEKDDEMMMFVRLVQKNKQ